MTDQGSSAAEADRRGRARLAASAAASSSSASAAAKPLPTNLDPPELNFKSLRALRWSDATYDEIHTYLSTGEFTEAKTDQQKKRLKKKADQFELDANGHIVLVVREVPSWARDPSGTKQLYHVRIPFNMRVVKESERMSVIKAFYADTQTNGYSASSFHERVSHDFLGISRSDIEATLKTFEVHQMGMAKNSVKVVKPIVSEYPMQHWQMDLIDMSQHHRLNGEVTFLLNVVDHFSKFAWSRPLKNKSVQNVASELQQIILQEGPPEILQSDNGGEFTGDKMQELVARFDIDHRFSLPYKPNTNGAVERFNGTLKEKIGHFLTDHSAKAYLPHLQQLVFSYNTAKHSTTKKTPFQVHRGRDVRISMLNTLVHQEIQKAADKMVADSQKEAQGLQDPLEEGDEVRVDMLALKSVRKMADFERKSKHIHNWSKEIYTVSEEKDQGDLKLYKIDPVPEGETERRWFYRNQLFKIDRASLVRAKAITDKRDPNFGAGPFDLELHLAQMPRGDRRVARMSEAELEIEADEPAPRPRRAGAGAGVSDRFAPMLAEGHHWQRAPV